MIAKAVEAFAALSNRLTSPQSRCLRFEALRKTIPADVNRQDADPLKILLLPSLQLDSTLPENPDMNDAIKNKQADPGVCLAFNASNGYGEQMLKDENVGFTLSSRGIIRDFASSVPVGLGAQFTIVRSWNAFAENDKARNDQLGLALDMHYSIERGGIQMGGRAPLLQIEATPDNAEQATVTHLRICGMPLPANTRRIQSSLDLIEACLEPNARGNPLKVAEKIFSDDNTARRLFKGSGKYLSYSAHQGMNTAAKAMAPIVEAMRNRSDNSNPNP